jgi:modulator of FtsH protease
MNPIRGNTASPISRAPGISDVLATNKVLRNTYMLLSMTLIFSGIAAYASMSLNFGGVGIIGFFIGAYGLMFLTNRLQNSVWGLPCVFAFTGFMGMMLGPILSAYLKFLPNGGQLIMTALGGTGLIFMGLSAYSLSSGKRFSNMAGSMVALGIVAMVAMVANIFLHLPMLSLAVSSLFMIFSSMVILYQTGEIIHGGETNYISATVSLYLSIYNIFVSLLQILGLTSGDD